MTPPNTLPADEPVELPKVTETRETRESAAALEAAQQRVHRILANEYEEALDRPARRTAALSHLSRAVYLDSRILWAFAILCGTTGGLSIGMLVALIGGDFS